MAEEAILFKLYGGKQTHRKEDKRRKKQKLEMKILRDRSAVNMKTLFRKAEIDLTIDQK